uniref:Uncharacterized protein n=1 Tax=Megaselia scalaris TaxID=36166 RepID=T1GM04_MEGSC
MLKLGDIGAHEANFMKMLIISTFLYSLTITQVYDSGSILSRSLGHQNRGLAPQIPIGINYRQYPFLLAIATATCVEFKEATSKEYIKDPSEFTAATDVPIARKKPRKKNLNPSMMTWASAITDTTTICRSTERVQYSTETLKLETIPTDLDIESNWKLCADGITVVSEYIGDDEYDRAVVEKVYQKSRGRLESRKFYQGVIKCRNGYTLTSFCKDRSGKLKNREFLVVRAICYLRRILQRSAMYDQSRMNPKKNRLFQT